ncbi:MAG: alpha/beta fold hydrolase [Anaerolineae bacterium]|nr:alpha/beta fold hydrolase [Anaerolineae bacterium]
MVIAIVLVVLIGLVLAVGLAASFHMTHRFGLAEARSPAEYGLVFEEVTFQAADGLTLHGWWIPAVGSDRAVVIMHGHGGSMDWDIHRAPALHAAGFNVLLFDFRAHGRSEGKTITFGYLERQDVLGAVRFLRGRGIGRIGLLGFSFGGIAAMLAAPICPDIAAVVTDGGPARMRSAIAARGVELGAPRWLSVPLAWLIVAMASLRLRVNLFHYEPVRWVGQISPHPILFVHAGRDQYLPDFDDLYAAARPPKEVWHVPEAGHTKVSEVLPEEFQRRVIAFFDQHL